MSTSAMTSVSRVESTAAHSRLEQHIRLPRPICWHEGMLLSPQHFQQNHQFWEGQLRQMISVLSPSFWGIRELELNRSALLEGVVDIQKVVAVMPDGMFIDYDAKVDAPLSFNITDEFVALIEKAPLTIQLAVPIQAPGSASSRAEIQRFTTREGLACKDENTADNEIVMPRLHPMLSLQAADRVGNRFVGLPIFRVIKPEGGVYQLDPDYSPPLLNIGADDFRSNENDMRLCRPLQMRCNNLASAVRHKARQLAGLSEDGESLGRNIAQRHHSWIRALVQELASVEQLSESPTTRPYDLYQGLIRMAGPISELDPNSVPPRFPGYDHDNAMPGFRQVIRYISQQVGRVNLNYTTLSLEEEREGVYSINVDKAWEEKDLLIELRPLSGGARDGLLRWMDSCRVASSSVHKVLRQRRLLGAKIEALESDTKTGIVPGIGNALFKIKADKRFILSGSKLVVMSTSKEVNGDRPAAILLHMPHE